MSLIKAEIWLATHPLFLWTDIINYTSFHPGSGFAYNIGLHWEPDDMFASNKLCLLIPIPSFSKKIYTCTSSSVTTDPDQPQSANGGPAAAHVWWWALWLLGVQPQGTQAGTCSVNEAKGCGHDVTTCRGCSEARANKYWRHIAKNDLQQVSIGPCYWSV